MNFLGVSNSLDSVCGIFQLMGYSLFISTHHNSCLQATKSISGSDHWAFNEQGTTASNINSKHHTALFFLQVGNAVLNSTHLPQSPSFSPQEPPNIFIHTTTDFPIFLLLPVCISFGLIETIWQTLSEVEEKHQHQPRAGSLWQQHQTQRESWFWLDCTSCERFAGKKKQNLCISIFWTNPFL